jgi:hypothetical protein
LQYSANVLKCSSYLQIPSNIKDDSYLRALTFTVCLLNSWQPSSQFKLNGFKWYKTIQIHKKLFITLFLLEISNKNCIIKNESIYVCMKFQSNQSLYKQFHLHSLTIILILKIFGCFFLEIHYRAEAEVCQIFWRQLSTVQL